MKTNLLINMIFLVSMISVSAQTIKEVDVTQTKIVDKLLFNVGSKIIDFTLPDSNYLEVSSRFKSLFDIFIPKQNRLICGFLTKSDVQEITDNKTPKLDSYIVVEVGRPYENLDCQPKDYQTILSSMGDLSTKFSSLKDGALNEFNEKLKTLNIQEVQLNNPVNLEVIFSKEDANAIGMILKVQQGEVTKTYMCSVLLMRLKEKLLFVYIFKKYLDQNTVKEVISLTDKYASSLLRANPFQI